jgi:hypothetical protein
MGRLIGQGVNVFRVKRTYRDYQIVDENGNVLVHITFSRSETPITEVKVWSYWLDVDNIRLPTITHENASIAYSILSKYFTLALSMKILEVAKRIFKRWGK